ncbi:MAG: VOC family protein [Verrucomicrobiota bacterium]
MNFENKPDPLLEIYSDTERLSRNEQSALNEMRQRAQRDAPQRRSWSAMALGSFAMGILCAGWVIVVLMNQPAADPNLESELTRSETGLGQGNADATQPFRAAAGVSEERAETHILRVRNLEASIRFYVKTFGFRLVSEKDTSVVLEAGGIRILLQRAEDPEPVLLQLSRESFEGINSKTDPDGNRIEVN